MALAPPDASDPSHRRYRLVAFDMDDTLFPEIEYVRSGYAAVAGHIAQIAAVPAERVLSRLWFYFESSDRRKVFDAVLSEFDLAERLSVPSLVEIYRNHQPRIRLRADAVEVLTRLRAANALLGVVTDGPLVMQQRKTHALGLAGYVDRIIFTDALPPGCAKPSPVPFQRLMDEFAVPADSCMYVADNPRKDFLGPRQLGWFTVQVLSDGGIYCREVPPAGGEPHVVVRSLREVLSLG